MPLDQYQITPAAVPDSAQHQSRACATSTEAPEDEFTVNSACWANYRRGIAAAAGEVVEFP